MGYVARQFRVSNSKVQVAGIKFQVEMCDFSTPYETSVLYFYDKGKEKDGILKLKHSLVAE